MENDRVTMKLLAIVGVKPKEGRNYNGQFSNSTKAALLLEEQMRTGTTIPIDKESFYAVVRYIFHEEYGTVLSQQACREVYRVWLAVYGSH